MGAMVYCAVQQRKYRSSAAGIRTYDMQGSCQLYKSVDKLLITC